MASWTRRRSRWPPGLLWWGAVDAALGGAWGAAEFFATLAALLTYIAVGLELPKFDFERVSEGIARVVFAVLCAAAAALPVFAAAAAVSDQADRAGAFVVWAIVQFVCG